MALNDVYWGIIVTEVLLLATALLITSWAFYRYTVLRGLRKTPAKSTARLTKKAGRRQPAIIAQITQASVAYYIHYEFKDSRGKAYPGKCRVTREIFDSIQPTKGIEVVYNHNKPTQNCLEANLERETFKFLMLFLIGLLTTCLLPFMVLN